MYKRQEVAEVRFSMTCSVVDGQGKRGNVHVPAIMSVDFPDVFDGLRLVYSRGNRTPESEEKQTSVYLIKQKMKRKFCIRTRYVYISFCCHVVLADTKRAAAHRIPGPERGVAAYRRTPEREQTVFYLNHP